MILNSPYISGSLTVTGNTTIQGQLTVTGSLSGTASLASNSLLLEGTGSTGFATTSSLLAVSSSQQQISASLLSLTASYNALSSSYTALSASYNVASSSFSTRITSDSSSLSSRTTQIENVYATTGSNSFTGVQNFSNTCTPNSFTAGASLYTAGGLRVTQDTYFSSSVYIKGNVTVYGTQSVAYISSSQLDIGTNIITVNTATPSIRYGGLSVFDSGSTGLTGSIFWDSELNRWIYSNASGSGGGATYGGGMFISGPRNSQGIGCEQGTTACMLLVGQGGDHLTSSMIYHDSTNTCFYPGTLIVSSSCQFIFGTSPADFAFNVGTTCVGTNAAIAQFYNNDYTAGTRGFIRVRNSANVSGTTSAYFGQGQDQKTYFYNNDPSRPGDIVITNTGKVGIGISSPNSQLHISSFDCVQTTTLATAYTAAKFRLDTYCGSGQGISMGNITGYQQYIQAQYSNLTTTNPLMLNPFGGIVGIGTDTNNPTGQKLFIQSNNDQAGVTMYNSYDCNMWALATGTTGINNKGFAIRDEINNATRLQIDNCGNVGIGTLSPGGRLDVVTCSNSTQYFYLRNTSNLDASSRAYFYVTAGNTSLSLLALAGGSSCGGTYIAGTCGADMYFQQQAGGTVNMIIKSDGKVGIGTTSPAGILEIKCAQNTYNRIVSCFEGSYTSGFAFSDLNGGIKYDAGNNVFCIYSTYPNYGGVMVQTGASQRMLITSCGSVNIGTLATGKHNVEIGDIKDGPGGFAYCYFLVAQGTWATFACVTNNDANVITDITYVNNNDSNRSGVFVARWAYNGTCAGLYIVSCLWNDSQNINQFGLRNNGGALQICLGGGANGYRVQARTQGARATG